MPTRYSFECLFWSNLSLTFLSLKLMHRLMLQIFSPCLLLYYLYSPFLLASTLPVAVSSHKSTRKKSSTLGYYELIDWMESRSLDKFRGTNKMFNTLTRFLNSTGIENSQRSKQLCKASTYHEDATRQSC